MITLILTLALHAAPAAPTVAQVQTCQWPNHCVEAAPVLPVQPCVWPNTCVETAQVQTCVWPHTCSTRS